ncbi:TPA: hypothetical protein OUF45_000612 [Klebsiella variicola]|nr:hypothetical protein [Klebsiella variicola]
MTSKLTRERLKEIAEDGFLKHGESRVLARMALAAMDSEPVFTLQVSQADYKGQKLGNHFGFITLDAARELDEGNYQLYRHAQPAPVMPDGYVMVPKEPTEEMLAAAKEWTGLTSTAEVVYIKMLAAAPQEVK